MNKYNQTTDILHNTKKNLKLEQNNKSLLIAAHSELSETYDFILPMRKPKHGDTLIYNDSLKCFEFNKNQNSNIKANKIETDNICSLNNDVIKIETRMQTEVEPHTDNDLINKKYVDNLQRQINFECNGKRYSTTLLKILFSLVATGLIE